MNHFWWSLIRRRPQLGWSLALAITATLSGLLLLAVSGGFITAAAAAGMAVAGGAYSFNLLIPSSAIRALAFIRTLSRYFERLIGHSATFDWIRTLRHAQFERLRHRPLLWQGEARAQLLQRYLVDIDNLEKGWLADAQPRWQLTISAGCSGLILLLLLPLSQALPIVLLLALAWVLASYRLKALAPWVIKAVDDQEQLRQQAFELRRFWSDIRLWGMGASRQQQFVRQAHQLARAQQHLINHQGLLGSALNLTLWLALALLWWRAEPDAVVPTIAATLLLLGWLEWLPVMVESGIQQHHTRVSANKLELPAPSSATETTEGIAPGLITDGNRLCLDSLSLQWGDRVLFQDLSVTLAKGESLVITGKSGSGKSSLLYVLMGLQEPTAGQIRLDHLAHHTTAPEQWLAHFALVPQHTELLQGTLRDNLRLAAPGADDAALWQVLEQVRLADKVRWLGGLDVLVGSQSLMLSGGESRRLALARALLRPAPVVLLDEPFSGLEQRTADALMADLRTLLEGRMWVLVTHDLRHAEGHHHHLQL